MIRFMKDCDCNGSDGDGGDAGCIYVVCDDDHYQFHCQHCSVDSNSSED